MTPSQTVGPFFAIGLPWEAGPFALAPDAPGTIRITGTVYDGAGDPVPDALLETWQADPDGRFPDMHGYGGGSQLAGFRGFARCGTDEADGRFAIVTVKPGPVPWPDGRQQAPHIDVSVLARGMLHRCVTRIYFEDEDERNRADPLLETVPPERRVTLLARRADRGYAFDIRLQGPGETVFFAV